MILTKADLKEYLEADKKSLERQMTRPRFLDLIWKYEIALRKSEYYHNSGGLFKKPLSKFYNIRLFILGTICGYQIPINSIDKGLALVHLGPVIIDSKTRIGKKARIHVGVNIGTKAGEKGLAPTIGDNVYIAPGAKIFGPISIGNNVAIGANAVVNKSFPEDNITLAGVPAKIISHKGSDGFLIKGAETLNTD